MRRIFILLAIFTLLAPVRSNAQAAGAAHSKPVALLLEEGLQLARAKRFAEVELLMRGEIAPGKETARWHLDFGQRLGLLAENLARGADLAGATEVARIALRHAQAAGSKAKSNRDRAKAKITEGKLHEIYLGDTEKALESYAAAAALDPANKHAVETHKRLRDSIANLKERLQANARK